jgi:hypothetical protein
MRETYLGDGRQVPPSYQLLLPLQSLVSMCSESDPRNCWALDTPIKLVAAEAGFLPVPFPFLDILSGE